MTLTGPSSQTYYSQRLRLHYADWGNADKPPLILLHGGRDHCRNWDWTAEALRDDWHIICPDLRGHGDSEWSADGNYPHLAYVYDLAQLIDQLDLAPATIVAHSLGGGVATHYTGLFPEKVKKLVSIEGLGPSPAMLEERKKIGTARILRSWIETKQKYAGKPPRRYPDFEAAHERMRDENKHLSDEQVRHLSIHAVVRNEDGTYSWKFDPLMHNWWPQSVEYDDVVSLWKAITCPTLLMYGADSWASNPEKDGRLEHFGDNVSVQEFADAGHWLHHDQFEKFIASLRAFL